MSISVREQFQGVAIFRERDDNRRLGEFPWLGPGGIARPFSTQIISVNRDVKQISVGFKKVTVEASEMTVGYMTV